MLAKVSFIYFHFFKLLIFLNIGISMLLAKLITQLDAVSFSFLKYIFVAKFFGYVISFIIEKWFYPKSRLFLFKNAGVGYRHIFVYLIILDLFYFGAIVWLWKIVTNFI